MSIGSVRGMGTPKRKWLHESAYIALETTAERRHEY
jgi:hypothetical protein